MGGGNPRGAERDVGEEKRRERPVAGLRQRRPEVLDSIARFCYSVVTVRRLIAFWFLFSM